MQGRLFSLFDVGYPSYFVLLLAGFVFATVMGALWAKRIGQNPDVVVDLGLAMLLAGVAGARLLHVVADGYFWDYVHLCTDPSQVAWEISRAECLQRLEPDIVSEWLGCSDGPTARGKWDAAAGVCRPASADCFAWAKFWAGGLTYYGGFVGASIAAWFLLKADRFPFWKAADDLGSVLFIHPVFDAGDDRVNDYGMPNAVGRITDSLISVSRLIYSGHVAKYKNAKIVVGIGGAALPYVVGRLRRNYSLDKDKLGDPDAALASFYYDTLLHDHRAVRFLAEMVGTDRMMMGSDMPFPIGDLDPMKVVSEAGFNETQRASINGGLAEKLLG